MKGNIFRDGFIDRYKIEGDYYGGASNGIGEATAKLLAIHDERLIVSACCSDRLVPIKEKYPEASILIQQADVTNHKDVSRVAKLALRAIMEGNRRIILNRP